MTSKVVNEAAFLLFDCLFVYANLILLFCSWRHGQIREWGAWPSGLKWRLTSIQN